MDEFLETDRLLLRPIHADDLDELCALHNDPEVMRYLTGGEEIPRHEVERDLRERFAKPGYWAAIERECGAFLGWFALHPTADRAPDDYELGYRLHRSSWGRGYATEGSRALIDRAFGAWGVRRVWATTMAVNLASRRVMEKAGLSHERTFYLEFEEPLPGTEQGEVEYALERAAWTRQEAAASAT